MIKRIFDIFISLTIILFFLPFGIIISFLIIIDSKGGVFYRQDRVGLNSKIFKMLKFRSMKIGADRMGQLTIGMKDKRVTKIGYFIRKFKLDEFPQFINVLIGEMSVVGPRPEVKKYTDLYNEEQKKVLNIKPGITDLASLLYFDENKLLGESENPEKTYIDEVMPEKIKINLLYCKKSNLILDLKIIVFTFLRIIGVKTKCLID